MSDPSAFSVIAGFALFFAFVFALLAAWAWTKRRFQTPARTGGDRQPSSVRGTRVPYHCATFGHYYAQESGHWVCQNDECRDTRPAVSDLGALDQMAFEQAHREDFRRWEASS